ncbi:MULTISPECIES: M1 family metallopeptidase [unclassified Janthinobacterium]|uniref:M1 family metallopeptidase n=1 Tax=unclassified Janthinobacterium TaxID=2610881 RepID=UPI0018CB2F63|nr:M1 family metallopeptidase [Janthinobacterium sp. CG_23.4]MDH6158600.1 aminopeptidase N [Janthinobacterium sp. CG_23.4]
MHRIPTPRFRRSQLAAAVLALTAITAFKPGHAAPGVKYASASHANATTTQLPRGVTPLHYMLSITPDAAAATFKGAAAIKVAVDTPTTSITLNALNLAFASAAIEGAGGSKQVTRQIEFDADKQTATLHFDQPLAKGEYQLRIDYSGKIGTQATGLFSLDYDTPQGRQRALYTQFENSDARSMLPSWDEPDYKATFALDVIVPSKQMAVGNMPIASSEELGNGMKHVRFATTPRMSTYLLFFGLGDFERATKMADGTEVGVITKKGALAQSRYALDESSALLREYNDYFGVRYPLPKLDNIAAPGRSQFFGAMENWGAVFTFEYALLLDPTISTQTDKENIYTTLSHEMAHQWFGDLVTMRWWDDLWLNEGFASWMESRTTERLHPEWNTALSNVGGRESAMSQDALRTTHPVVQRIATVEQASQAFDGITYQKGEAVIRMLEAYVGADTWRTAVRNYMRKHAYGNTVSDDLWREVDAAAGKPVSAIAHDFTLQPGVPMITVSDAVCSKGSTRVTLTQSEFSKDQPDKKPLSWKVPVIASTVGNGKPARVLVKDGKAILNVPGCGALLVNVGQSGYYRTVYAPAGARALAGSFARLAPIDQLGLLADSQSLSMAGLQDPAGFLELLKATPLSADPQVLGRVAASLNSLYEQYAGDSVDSKARQKAFGRFAMTRLTPMMTQTGWEARAGEASSVATLRGRLISILGDMGEPGVLQEARRRYAASLHDPAAMSAALRSSILGVVAQHADAATWEQLHAKAKQEKTPLVKNQLYDLLAASDDAALAQRALTLALTEEPGVTNSAAMISRVSRTHPELAFDFALAHLEQVYARIDASSRSRYVPRLAAASAQPDMIAKLEAYAQAHLPAGARGDADSSVAGIKYRIKLRAERLPAIDAWLAKQAG